MIAFQYLDYVKIVYRSYMTMYQTQYLSLIRVLRLLFRAQYKFYYYLYQLLIYSSLFLLKTLSIFEFMLNKINMFIKTFCISANFILKTLKNKISLSILKFSNSLFLFQLIIFHCAAHIIRLIFRMEHMCAQIQDCFLIDFTIFTL